MAEPLSAPAEKPKASAKSQEISDLTKEIGKRRSQELVIGLCGAIGSGTRELEGHLKSALETHGYSVETVRISDLICTIKNDPALLNLSGFEKHKKYQDAGNEIRKTRGSARLAEQAVVEIVNKREKYKDPNRPKDGPGAIEGDKITGKVAYIINQLKNPAEVALLQAVYKQNFYLLGLIRTERERKTYLEQAPMKPEEADTLINIDLKDSEKYGQQVEKTFYVADYFIRNKHNNAAHLNKSLDRFIRLVHGYNGVPPSLDEVGMFEAFSASLQSACLSRQVGAAIMSSSGDILATGCNDVPAYGGGLYTSKHGEGDQRCIFKGRECYNDLYKRRLQAEFQVILEGKSIPGASLLAKELLDNTRAKALIEYSRAVHAEMDALIQLARTEGQTTVNATLYCTTYPCHSCARHIVSAGISKVIYIEPYDKSLAIALHDDSITDSNEPDKVIFEPFEGVPPRRYSKFFLAQDRKDKDTGKAIIIRPEDSHHIDPQYLDSYHAYEDKVLEKITGKKAA